MVLVHPVPDVLVGRRGRYGGPGRRSVVVLVDVELGDVKVSGSGGLLERLEALADPRSRHGKLHGLAGLLTIAAAAVLAGARTYTAIGEYAREVPQATLARLGIWRRPYFTWYVAPSETTLRRVLQQIDPDELDRVVGGWLAARQRPASTGEEPGAVAVDGKMLRGARQADGHQVHLFAALAHGRGTILAQRQVPKGTNEVTQFRPLLDQVDLAGRVVTADALHTQADHADYLVGKRQADYLFCVKGNQPRAPAFSRYELYVRIVVDDPAAPDRRRRSVHHCAAALIEWDES